MTDEEQEARALKWERGGSITIRQLKTGNFAAYLLGGIGSPFWIGPFSELEQAYANRPAPAAIVREPRVITVKGIDVSKLEINI